MNTPRCVRRPLWLFAFPLFAACAGDGSDIGPKFPNLPDASCKVSVFDDQGRGVVAAVVSVPAQGWSAVTGINGRGDLLANPRGRFLVNVDGSNAAAVAGDRLGTLDFATTVQLDLPSVVHLPVFPDSASAFVAAGTQAGTTTVTSVAGAICTVAAASSVGLPNGAPSAFLRLGDLQANHLPGELPVATGATLLFTRGVFIEPASATFAPGASLDVADELALPGSASASLYRLDPSTGEWVEVLLGVTASGGRLVANGVIATGGLYAFATAVPSATVVGRLVELNNNVLRDQLVNVDGRWVATDSSGRFSAVTVPGALANGAARTAQIEVFAGGGWLPNRLTTTGAVSSGGTLDLGDVTFDTVPCTNLRVQQVRRGRAEGHRRLAVSASEYPVARVTTGNAAGQAFIEDLPAEYFGFQEGFPLDEYEAAYAQSLGYVNTDQRWQNASMFYDDLAWYVSADRTRVMVVDRIGTGPLDGAGVVTGNTGGQGYIGTVEEAGSALIDRNGTRVTASYQCICNGMTAVSAVSVERNDSEHLEMPLVSVNNPQLAAFARHGLVAGTLIGANASRVHELRSTRWLEASEWWDDVVDGVPIVGAVPLDVDPAVTHADFRVGVDVNGGHLAVAELAVTGSVRVLEKLGVALAVQPTQAAVQTLDLTLSSASDTVFTVANGLLGLDASLPVADLRCDLALELPDARIVDVVRDLGGNHAASGADLALSLPGLTGALAGNAWRVHVGGTATVGGEVIGQQTIVRLRGDLPETAVPMLAVPTLTAPANGATVPAAGFTVSFVLPADADYGRIDLVHEAAGEHRSWRAYLVPTATEFVFVRLPAEVATPLIAGKTWSLTLSAYRIDDSVLTRSDSVYRDVTTFLQSVSPIEVGAVAVSSRTITVTSN